MSRKTYTGEGVSVSGPYSHAVDAGSTIFFSGQVAKNAPDYKEATGSIEEQTKQCFKNLEKVLNTANATFSDVVKVNVYLTTMKNFQGMNAVYETVFSEPYPARTCVAVKELPLEADIEIELVVYKEW